MFVLSKCLVGHCLDCAPRDFRSWSICNLPLLVVRSQAFSSPVFGRRPNHVKIPCMPPWRSFSSPLCLYRGTLPAPFMLNSGRDTHINQTFVQAFTWEHSLDHFWGLSSVLRFPWWFRCSCFVTSATHMSKSSWLLESVIFKYVSHAIGEDAMLERAWGALASYQYLKCCYQVADLQSHTAIEKDDLLSASISPP